jgi:hypothetical protein
VASRRGFRLGISDGFLFWIIFLLSPAPLIVFHGLSERLPLHWTPGTRALTAFSLMLAILVVQLIAMLGIIVVGLHLLGFAPA